MNPVWLARNVFRSWRYCATAQDAVARLWWNYAHKLPPPLRRAEYLIGFKYPSVGEIRVLVRANSGSDGFVFGEVFEHEYYRLPIAPPATIMDLGANAGFTAVYFGRIYPEAKIACVEPMRDNARVLRHNLHLNGIAAVVVEAAADIRDGAVSMVSGLDYGHKVGAGDIEVKAVTLPSLLDQLGWERIGLLKVDIEGHEKVLFSTNCDWLHRVDNLCIECHDNFGEEDLKSIATRFGFSAPLRLPGIWFMGKRPDLV
jgi:FkbM family methyltransferase